MLDFGPTEVEVFIAYICFVLLRVLCWRGFLGLVTEFNSKVVTVSKFFGLPANYPLKGNVFAIIATMLTNFTISRFVRPIWLGRVYKPHLFI